MRKLVVALLISLVWAAPAHAVTKTPGSQTMDDGAALSTLLYLPDGAAPAGGWPGVLVLHGLGGNKESMDLLSSQFAAAGYAVLAYDARGHGASTGNVELASAREVADLRAIRNAFAARGDVNDTAIGAWGISYGGGQIWNALKAGVPLAAVAVTETWTDLYAALWPQNVARSGIVAGFAVTSAPRSPLIASLRDDAVQSRNMDRVRALVRERSLLPCNGCVQAIRTPVYMFQGRQDFAFDVAQATQPFALLGGPKKLYVGNFGHSPSTFPGLDIAYVLQQSVAWYDRHMKGVPNGVDAKKVVIARQGSPTARVELDALPATRTHVFALGGTSTVRGSGIRYRTAPRLSGSLETWGGGTVHVQVTKLSRYPRLVVTVLAGNKIVTHGALVPRRGRNVVRLANYCVFVPRGTRLRVAIGPASPPGQLAYLQVGTPGSATIGSVTLRLPVLRTPVSG